MMVKLLNGDIVQKLQYLNGIMIKNMEIITIVCYPNGTVSIVKVVKLKMQYIIIREL